MTIPRFIRLKGLGDTLGGWQEVLASQQQPNLSHQCQTHRTSDLVLPSQPKITFLTGGRTLHNAVQQLGRLWALSSPCAESHGVNDHHVP